MNKLFSFEQFAAENAAKSQKALQEEQDAKRTQTAESFKSLLSEYGVTSVKELDEEKRSEFFEKLRGADLNESTQMIAEGTRSHVGKIDKKGNILSTYVHYDGYPEYMVPVIKHYSNSAKVNQLLDLGKSGISFLDKKIGNDKQDFNNPEKGTTLFYGRDRGETSDMTVKGNIGKMDKYLRDLNNSWAEYAYLFDERDNTWYMIDTNDGEMKIAESFYFVMEGKRETGKVLTQWKHSGATDLNVIARIYVDAMEDANFHTEKDITAKAIGAPSKVRKMDINLEDVYSNISHAAAWNGHAIAQGTVEYLKFIGQEDKAEKLLKSITKFGLNENTAYTKRVAKILLNEALKATRPKDNTEIDIDFAGSSRDLKNVERQYGLSADEYEPGMVLLTGAKQDLLDYLQSPEYDMDPMDIKDLFPELLEGLVESKPVEVTTTVDNFFKWYTGGEKNWWDAKFDITVSMLVDGEHAEEDGEGGATHREELRRAKNQKIKVTSEDMGNAFDNYFAVNGREYGLDSIDQYVGESKVLEAEIKSDEEFKEYAYSVLQNAFGDEFDQAKADEVVNGLLGKADGDYGKAAGMLQASLA